MGFTKQASAAASSQHSPRIMASQQPAPGRLGGQPPSLVIQDLVTLQMAKEGRPSRDRATKKAVTREYTINLHKRLHNITFKKKAPRAVKEIRKFAQQHMKTSDVRLDVKLNKAVWMRVSVAEGAGYGQVQMRAAGQSGAAGFEAGLL